ncbi:tRNA (adenosine(37)-N6)-threonylcarbamoyltransferase complex ATPase subunit type 1 TsaE [Arthrobacter sp. Sr33]|uniref:tRNA (adenosine(37)-N6)-threonylcarbamoyltransferase complex ATPase subunit type 1 TsaE n=3 Tax=unclassified Arthrobacter TaxID=235627 RepID=UPI0003107FAE|nr:tRNA (adenosine(37)-N6)-threonylcarbamoyltransferase complex ATPase subunit type 1 TsaE [Arthrobacter sp. TB 23]
MQTSSGHSGPAWSRSFTVHSAAGLQRFAAALGGDLAAGDLLILTGGLGAGKTTFTQGLGVGLGVRPGIISPTFVLVRVHPPLASGPALVHADAYRLESAADIDDLDLESTMDTSVTVVEWGAGRVEHLAESHLEIHLDRPAMAGASADPDDDDEPRRVLIEGYGQRWANTPSAVGSLD